VGLPPVSGKLSRPVWDRANRLLSPCGGRAPLEGFLAGVVIFPGAEVAEVLLEVFITAKMRLLEADPPAASPG
jgi:hypothetical protein